MIFCQCNFFSKVLKNHVNVNVLLPSMPDNECFFHEYNEIYPENKKYKTIYLLHGALEDYSGWIRHTAVERYAEEKEIAVVMPSGQNGFYSNAVAGLDYFDFITGELPLFVRHTFPLSEKRGDNYIAGASMGGYGAVKCSLKCPEQYGAFGDFSGAVDPEKLEPLMAVMGFEIFCYDLIFGGAEKVTGSQDDLYVLAEQLKSLEKKPEAFIACGLEDTNNYAMNARLRDTLYKNNFKVHFEDGQGKHDWEYWDTCIRNFINYVVR